MKKQKGVYSKKLGPILDRLGLRNSEQKKGKTYAMKDKIKEVARYVGYCVRCANIVWQYSYTTVFFILYAPDNGTRSASNSPIQSELLRCWEFQ